LLEEERKRKRRACNESLQKRPARAQCSGVIRTHELQKKNHHENAENTVAVIERKRQDAISAQDGQRRGQQQRDSPRRAQPSTQCRQHDPPGQHRSQGADHCGVENVMEEYPSAEANEGGLNQKRERRVSQRKIPIRRLAQRDAEGCVQNVARIPKDREMRILPQDHGCAG